MMDAGEFLEAEEEARYEGSTYQRMKEAPRWGATDTYVSCSKCKQRYSCPVERPIGGKGMPKECWPAERMRYRYQDGRHRVYVWFDAHYAQSRMRELGVTHDAAAEALGVHANTVGNRLGKSRMPEDDLSHLARILDCDAEELLCG